MKRARHAGRDKRELRHDGWRHLQATTGEARQGTTIGGSPWRQHVPSDFASRKAP